MLFSRDRGSGNVTPLDEHLKYPQIDLWSFERAHLWNDMQSRMLRTYLFWYTF